MREPVNTENTLSQVMQCSCSFYLLSDQELAPRVRGNALPFVRNGSVHKDQRRRFVELSRSISRLVAKYLCRAVR